MAVAAVAGIILLGASSAAASPGAGCEPALDVRGTPGVLVEAVRAEVALLALHPPRPGCLAARATVAQSRGAIEVWFTDVYGRETHRRVHAVPELAAWLESMVKGDLLDDLLPGAPPPAPPGPPPPPPVAVVPPPAVVIQPVTVVTGAAPRQPPPTLTSRLRLSGGPAYGVSFVGESSTGGQMELCAMLGEVCLGLTLRGLVGVGAPNHRPTPTIHALANVQWWHWRRFAPYLGVGMRRILSVPDLEPQESTGTHTRSDLRIEAGASLAIPLSARFALEARAYVGYQPAAGREQGGLGMTGDSGLALILRWQ